jgi:ribosome biogenesis protein UTP30
MSKVNPKTVTDAVRALYAYLVKAKEEVEESKLQLWEEDSDISLLFALMRTPAQEKNKPFRIPLKHSLYRRQGVEICLITADPGSDYREILAKNPVENITKVIGMKGLRHKYIPYKDKRTLLNSYQAFMADKRVTNLLSPLLGQKFFQKKRQPIPVKLTLKDENLVKELQQARDSTYLFIRKGPCCAVRIAKTSFTQEEVVENILAAIDPIVKNLPKQWKGLQAIYLKTHDSIALPVYNNLPDIDHKISLTPKKPASIKTTKKNSKKHETDSNTTNTTTNKKNKKRKRTEKQGAQQNQKIKKEENKKEKFQLKKKEKKKQKAEKK